MCVSYVHVYRCLVIVRLNPLAGLRGAAPVWAAVPEGVVDTERAEGHSETRLAFNVQSYTCTYVYL